MLKQVLEFVDRRHRDVLIAKERHPLGGGSLAQAVLDEIEDLFVGNHPGVESLEPRILDEFGATDQSKEFVPMKVRIRQECQVAVFRWVGLAHTFANTLVAHRPKRRLECRAPQVLGEIERGEGFEHRQLDLLAPAGALAVEQRQHHGIGRVHGADLVDDR